jgi:hypothetical protein
MVGVRSQYREIAEPLRDGHLREAIGKSSRSYPGLWGLFSLDKRVKSAY